MTRNRGHQQKRVDSLVLEDEVRVICYAYVARSEGIWDPRDRVDHGSETANGSECESVIGSGNGHVSEAELKQVLEHFLV